MSEVIVGRLEALLDAIVAYTHYTDPTHPQYQFRNPLGLQMFCPHATYFKNCPQCKTGDFPTVHYYDHGVVTKKYDKETGLRIYNTHIQGYQGALHDLTIKCSGKSKSKVRETSSIKELIRSYCLPDGTAACVARFLRKALKDENISENTPIQYFAESARKEEPCLTTATSIQP
jgi:hypothetical protein